MRSCSVDLLFCWITTPSRLQARAAASCRAGLGGARARVSTATRGRTPTSEAICRAHPLLLPQAALTRLRMPCTASGVADLEVDTLCSCTNRRLRVSRLPSSLASTPRSGLEERNPVRMAY